ncbi:hypothetical protein N665_1519s0005 [Sinapis alba]|nr:hypothetical protein N665_1519s0005 [Sinapis alba]
MQSPSTSGTMVPSSQQQQQLNLPSFQSPTSSSNNNYPSQNGITSINNHMGSTNLPTMQQAAAADEANESSSVQKILNEILMNNQAHNTTSGGGHESFGNDGKGGSNVNSSGVLMMNGQVNTSIGGAGGMGQSMGANGVNNINGNNGLMNGRVGMMVRDPNVQQDVGNQLLGAVNGFNNFQCDWNV